MEVQPIVLINAVGLTSRWLRCAPRLQQLASAGWSRSLEEIVPAVTCSAQATLLTGKTPRDHGIVGNGWFFRETAEIRFWQQANTLLQAEPIYVTALRRRGSKAVPSAPPSCSGGSTRVRPWTSA